MIQSLPLQFDVAQVVAELDAHPYLWNQHSERLGAYGPHADVSDIWLRYRDFADHADDPAGFFRGPHVSTWYDAIWRLPAVWSIVRRLQRATGAAQLGGVLLTRIPPGGEVLPHVDRGWHAEHYEKYAVQIKGNQDQVFGFEDDELRPEAGDVYRFDNGVLHWVKNESQEERITLIACLL